MMIKIMILMTVFFTHLTFALTVEDPRGKVLVDMPQGWTYEQNLLGLPHVFLSETRPKTSVSLTLTGQAGAKLNSADLKKNQGEYQMGRKTWASERNAKIVRFLPYENVKLKNVSGHWVGFVYEMDGKTYEEDSLYLECPSGLVHLKTLGIDQSSSLREGQKLMKSVSCL